MIKLTDTLTLAFTKLRTRKIRTTITILLANLLFSILIAASLIMNGAFTSLDSFRSDGLTSRHIVNVSKAFSDSSQQNILRDPGLISKAKLKYEQLVEKKTLEAKRLGVMYNQASDRPPYIQASSGKSDSMLDINDPNGIVRALLFEKFKNQPAFDEGQLDLLAKRYNAKNIFSIENFTLKRGASLDVLPEGKEVFYDTSDAAAQNAHYRRPLIDPQLTLSPPEITKPFILPNNAGWKPESDELPIILPQNVVEQLLGVEKMPAMASTTEKLDRLKTVKERASLLKFDVCYRNKESAALIQQTVQQQNDIAANADDKDYRQPSLRYKLPDPTTCENPTILSDTRSRSEKLQDENKKLFDKEFNNTVDPLSYSVSLKVVGVSPAQQSDNEQSAPQQIRNINDIIDDLLKTSGVGQTIPKELYDQIPNKAKYADLLAFTPLYFFGNEDNKTRYIEFSNAQVAKVFIDEQSCTVQYDNTCQPAGRPYQALLSYSNSAALDDVHTKAEQLFNYSIIVVAALAVVVMWITIGRTVTDGRHETAVFRAIGFKRIDIAMVYILYTVILSLFVVVFAGILGYAGAYLIDQNYAPLLTLQAQYGFGGLDLTKKFSLIGINPNQLGLLLTICLGTGLFSMILPLLRNIRRSPIRDMRDS